MQIFLLCKLSFTLKQILAYLNKLFLHIRYSTEKISK